MAQWRHLGPTFSSRPSLEDSMHHYYIHVCVRTLFTFSKQCWAEKKEVALSVIISNTCALLIIEQERQEKIAHSLRSGTSHMKHLLE